MDCTGPVILMVITGKGKHSAGNIPVLLPAVIELMKARGMPYEVMPSRCGLHVYINHEDME